MSTATDEQPVPAPALLQRLRDHFGQELTALPVVQQKFDLYERPNLHLALEELLADPKRQSELLGVLAVEDYRRPALARLCRASSAAHYDEAPVEYADVSLPDDRSLACLKTGLALVREEGRSLAVLITEEEHGWPVQITVEVLAADRTQAEMFLRQLAQLARRGKAYRGHVLTVAQGCRGEISVGYQPLPRISRADLVLPEALLQRIERHTLSFNRHAEKLRAARRHIKRGILLHGPPGTGKTLTVMYLVSQMPGRTVLLLTGAGMGIIETACKLARMLAPATVVLEDVDLIGTQRHRQTVDANALLFELLNQMDGLAEDIDVLFLLTTNRPDILEPALAAGPGRIDQAIEVPPPDAECRQRLFDLYSQGLRVEVADWPRLIDRIAGASGAFIREALRKGAVYAAEEGDGMVVRDGHLDEALADLLIAGGPLTRSLLGVSGNGDG